MRLLCVIAALCFCLSTSAEAEALDFLVQSQCADGSPYWACPDPQPLRANSEARWRHADFYNYSGIQAFDSGLSQSGNYIVAAKSYAPFGRFLSDCPAHNDGGDVYQISGGIAFAVATQDCGHPSTIQKLCLPTCGWWLFDETVANSQGEWRYATDDWSPSVILGCNLAVRWPNVIYPARGYGWRLIGIDTIISTHFANPDCTGAAERFFFGKGTGLIAWEAWSPACPEINDPYPLNGPPSPGYVLCDKHLTTEFRPTAGWSLSRYGWPPAAW